MSTHTTYQSIIIPLPLRVPRTFLPLLLIILILLLHYQNLQTLFTHIQLSLLLLDFLLYLHQFLIPVIIFLHKSMKCDALHIKEVKQLVSPVPWIFYP